jgi:hypothetical protein
MMLALLCLALFSSAPCLPAATIVPVDNLLTAASFPLVYLSLLRTSSLQPCPTMKFTSIVFAALVAATQFSSTFAGKSNEAAVDSSSTYLGIPVTIDVSANDNVQDAGDNPRSIKDAFADFNIMSYVLKKGTAKVANGLLTINKGVASVDNCKIGGPDQFLYTPNAGFTGTDTFEYQFTITRGVDPRFGDPDTQSGEVTVTVIVSATPIKQTFEIPGLVSSGDAVKYTHEELSNIVAITPGTPDMDSFNAIVKPVFGGSADFAANTSTEVVQQNLSDIFLNFYNFFRGGN